MSKTLLPLTLAAIPAAPALAIGLGAVALVALLANDGEPAAKPTPTPPPPNPEPEPSGFEAELDAFFEDADEPQPDPEAPARSTEPSQAALPPRLQRALARLERGQRAAQRAPQAAPAAEPEAREAVPVRRLRIEHASLAGFAPAMLPGTASPNPTRRDPSAGTGEAGRAGKAPVTAERFTRKATPEAVAAALAGGPAKRKDAVAALMRAGIGKSAAYAALKPAGPFSGRLLCLPGGRVAWQG